MWPKKSSKEKINPYALEATDSLYSEKKLGFSLENDKMAFRVFAPRALSVKIAFFKAHDDAAYAVKDMVMDENGVWEYFSPKELWGRYYGYYVKGPKLKGEAFNDSVCIADPYSIAVTSKNTYKHPARSFIYKDEFDWEGDTWVTPEDPRDLVIYESHLRDLTAHPDADIDEKGSYLGLIEDSDKHGLAYLKSLNINAVEFLPLHEFGNIEIPWQTPAEGVTNTWNPYDRNHWGYMTSYFFAPENYYASGGSVTPGEWNGVNGQQVREFKELVKKFHSEGIAVILDVVYNHVSQYDQNPLKFLDKKYYFRLDKKFNYLSVSGCGNDFRTEALMARRLIVDSVIYWMTEYHIDGFRFDLAAMIDEKTLELIREEALKVNPNVIIIAEPWGGGYMPERFSELGWASWNDKFRNAVKGQNPYDRPGFIFGRWDNGVTKDIMPGFFTGTLLDDKLTYQDPRHAVNYLESHDDHTFGDFVRLAIGKVKENDIIDDVDEHALLTHEELSLNKFGAFVLATSQGMMMIHSGQEFARSKVIFGGGYPDDHAGRIDHNSYNKDDLTNYINYDHAFRNKDLLNYYRNLIKMRLELPELRKADPEKCSPVFSKNSDYALGYKVTAHDELRESYILYNASAESTALFELGDGYYDIYADESTASDEAIKKGIMGQVTVAPRSGLVLIKHQ